MWSPVISIASNNNNNNNNNMPFIPSSVLALVDSPEAINLEQT
jgi:hypothetical protein